MSFEANATANALEKAANDLQWLLRTTEDATSALVSAFQGLNGETDQVLGLAAGIVECVEDERVSSVLSSVNALGAVAEQFVGDRLEATSGIIDTVAAEMELLRQLTAVTEGQAKIALEIKVLNVHTKVEVAHLGQVGAGFAYLARELADFAQSLSANTEELTNHTENRKKTIQNTQAMLAAELPYLREELKRIESDLSSKLAAVDLGLKELSRTPAQFKRSTEDIARQVGGVVVAFQGHDITRQQIEHVQEALELISGTLLRKTEEESDRPSQAAKAYAGLLIQISQLRAIKGTIADWTSQIKTCLDSILHIGTSELAGIGPLVEDQERSIASQLSHIELLERQCQQYSEKIRSALEGISNLSQLIGEHLHKSESARNRLRLLTYNSVIEASRLGSKADTICVIADRISEVAVDWSKITDQSSGLLTQLMDLSKHINQVVATFSHGNSQSLAEAQGKTRDGLESLRNAAAFAVVQGQTIETAAETMRAKGSSIQSNSNLLDTCLVRIEEVLAQIEAFKTELELKSPGVAEEYDAAEVEALFSGSYTTQMERQVLYAALHGGEIQVEYSAGNDVELF